MYEFEYERMILGATTPGCVPADMCDNWTSIGVSNANAIGSLYISYGAAGG